MESRTIKKTDWKNFELSPSDFDFIHNYLLEKETPLSTRSIAEAVISERIRILKSDLKKELARLGKIYRPSDTYEIGESVAFTQNGNRTATVVSIREGHNPDIADFSVTKFAFENGDEKEFATALSDHALNDLDPLSALYPDFTDLSDTMKKFGKPILKSIRRDLTESEDLVCISDYWFPSALLADVNLGFLNLAEAVMEMENGVPVPTAKILEMIEYPSDSNAALTEFSFNFALKNDERFDEVGPLGKILWTLNSLEPEDVRKVPLTLRYRPTDYAKKASSVDLDPLDLSIHDELDQDSLEQPYNAPDHFDFCLTYPHWKAGTLPLLGAALEIFPTAMEANHFIFDFVDEASGEKIMGWIVRDGNYIAGLKSWFRSNKIIPGNFIRVRPGECDSEVTLSKIPARSSKDWIRTALFDAKGRLSFETRQQQIAAAFDERLAISVENSPNLDLVWENHNRPDLNFERFLKSIFRELTRENPQGIVHFSELYAGINMFRRCAPKELLAALTNIEDFTSLSNLYFKMNQNESDGEAT